MRLIHSQSDVDQCWVTFQDILQVHPCTIDSSIPRQLRPALPYLLHPCSRAADGLEKSPTIAPMPIFGVIT